MSNDVWSDLHKTYKEQDWIDKPSIFAEQALNYSPSTRIFSVELPVWEYYLKEQV